MSPTIPPYLRYRGTVSIGSIKGQPRKQATNKDALPPHGPLARIKNKPCHQAQQGPTAINWQLDGSDGSPNDGLTRQCPAATNTRVGRYLAQAVTWWGRPRTGRFDADGRLQVDCCVCVRIGGGGGGDRKCYRTQVTRLKVDVEAGNVFRQTPDRDEIGALANLQKGRGGDNVSRVTCWNLVS